MCILISYLIFFRKLVSRVSEHVVHILREILEVDLSAVGLGTPRLRGAAAGRQLGLGHGNDPRVARAEEGHGLEGALPVLGGQQGLPVPVLDASAKGQRRDGIYIQWIS